MKVLIVGGGNTLYFLCRAFTAKGHDVIVVNRDKAECERLARGLAATVVFGDGSDPKILREAGAMGADVVLAITPHDQDNLVICQLARLQHGVPRALALANDPENAEVFQKLGVAAFSTAAIIASLIEQRASVDRITNLLPVAEGRVNVTEILLDASSPVVGRLLKDISLPESALVAVVIRGEQTLIPRGNSELQAGDRVVLMTLPENHGPVLRVLTGEQG
ncbi:MAG: NAD-binding protein [Candidatus Eisenbacteria bacterium]|jgi:trk system potassium uptake protein TrkA|nr:NAD-binding protein [Candidatus Eisenbacteria bacterium]